MFVSLIGLSHKLEFCGVVIHAVRAELGEVVSRVGLGAKKRLEVKSFRSKMGQDIKRISRNSIGEVGDNSETIPYVGGFIEGYVDGW